MNHCIRSFLDTRTRSPGERPSFLISILSPYRKALPLLRQVILSLFASLFLLSGGSGRGGGRPAVGWRGRVQRAYVHVCIMLCLLVWILTSKRNPSVRVCSLSARSPRQQGPAGAKMLPIPKSNPKVCVYTQTQALALNVRVRFGVRWFRG